MNDDWKSTDPLPDWDTFDLDWLNDAAAKPAPAAPTSTEKAGAEAERPKPTSSVRNTQAPPRTSEARPRQPVRSQAKTPARQSRPEPRTRVVDPAPRDYRPSRRRGRGGGTNKLLIVLIVLLGLGMVFAAWQLGSIFLNYHRDRSAYEELANMAVTPVTEEEEETEEDPESETAPVTTRIVSEVPISVDWDYLMSINSHVVGWLYCEGTVINYPVVQVSDHDFYLNHGFDGKSNTSGTLFADRNSVIGINQSNYTIYGHNMKDESMFGTYKNYVDKSYYVQHPVMYYLTPNGNYRIDLICAHIVEATDENFPGYFSNVNDYQTFLNQITSDSFWVNYDAISTEHQLISMSTCTSAAGYEDPRFVVYGMLIPIQ